MADHAFPLDESLATYRLLLLIRRFEERCERLFAANKVRGAMHLYSGQEAVAVGTCRGMSEGDALSFTYRSHGWALARGIPPVSVFAEIFGRASGCSAGRGGSKHLGDWDRRILPSNAIVGAHVPIGVGIALADGLQDRRSVSVTAFGDGAMNQGVVHESLTLASLWKLPVVFLCENNQYGEMTPVAKTLPTNSLLDRAAGHGVKGMTCDGMDVDDVTAVVARALDEARSGAGPIFVEARTYRFCGHHTGDAETYRDKDEVLEWRQRDPLVVQANRLLAAGVSADELERIEAEVIAQVAAAEEQAWNAPEPEVRDILTFAPSWATVTA